VPNNDYLYYYYYYAKNIIIIIMTIKISQRYVAKMLQRHFKQK